ncbi:hypothetical protein ACKWTF_015238 [Chironomus riparius]
MPKRRRTASPQNQNQFPDHIKIKIEKDCEEEESIVIQNFQLASSFDEANKIKKEVEISYELAVEDNEERIQQDIEDGTTSDDEIESSSGNTEGSNQRSTAKLTENEVQVKLEPDDYSDSREQQHEQQTESCQDKSSNSEAIKEEFMIIKEEIEDFGVDFVKIEVKITKVDMAIAEPYAKKFKLDQAKSTSRKSTSGRKSVSKVSEEASKSNNSVKKDEKGSKRTKSSVKSASKFNKTGVIEDNLSRNESEDSNDSDQFHNDEISATNHDSDSNSSQPVHKSGKSLKISTNLKKIDSKKDQKGSKPTKSSKLAKSLPQSTSKSRKIDNSDSNSTNIKNSDKSECRNSKVVNNQQKDGKYFKIFDQCKPQGQKDANFTSDTQNLKEKTKKSNKTSESASKRTKPNKSTRKSRSSLSKASKSENHSTKVDPQHSKYSNTSIDNNEDYSNELYSRLSIEDTKDPRLAALFTKISVKKEQGTELTSKSSQNADIKKLHEMHLDALGLGTDMPNTSSADVNFPSTSKNVSNSTPKKEFQCKLCPKSFDKRVSLINHQAAHTSYDYPCLKCGLKFKTSRAFKNHECPICQYCGKKFKNKPKLIRHVTYVHSEKSNLELFTCDICGKALKYKVSIYRHMTEHLEVTKNLRFKCEICNKSFMKRMGLQNHQILHVFATLSCDKCGMKFKKQKPYDQHKCLTCTHCPKNFSSKTKLNDHIRNMHTDLSELSLFICDICGKSFKYRPSIVRHVLDHRKEAKYKCEVCGKKWKSDIALRDHIRMCHAAELITCKICLKQMKPQCIYQHMRYVHSEVRDFKCKMCDAAFKTKEKLKRHLDTHNRKFNCDQCDRKFSSQYELTEHLKWHEDPEIFKCSICKKSFSTRTSLTTHSKLHKGIVRDLKCPHCPFITHRKESIKYHLTTHEKRDKKLEMKKNWLKCEKCGALLKNKASLWGHHRKVHPTERFTCDFCGIVVKTKHSLKHHIENKHAGN